MAVTVLEELADEPTDSILLFDGITHAFLFF